MQQHIAELGPKAWFETSSGARILYRDYAPKYKTNLVPLVCLHGFMRNSRDFCALGEMLAASGVRVIAPDMRGRGFSTWYTKAQDYHYDLIKQDMAELLDHLELERVAVLGVALGGMIAMDWAADRQGRVAGYILNDLGAEVVEQSSQRMASNAGNVQAVDFTFDEAVDRMKLHFGTVYPDFTHERWVDYTLRAYREMTPGRYARDFDMLAMEDAKRLKSQHPTLWPEFLATKDVPVAILRGEHSDFFTADCAQRMAAQHPKAILTTVPGRGHPPLLDEPQSLLAIGALLGRASH